jgi:hypothetical protein
VSGTYSHNTIVATENTDYYNYGIYGYFNASTDLTFNNNIVVVGGNSRYGYAHYGLLFGGTLTNISWNNNVYYATSAVQYRHGSTTSTSAAAYVASGAETGSIAANPNFVNAANGNYTPTNPAISNMGVTGMATAYPTTGKDYTKATRTACGPDPGAFEFSIDHSVSSLSTLPTTECGNYEHEVSVRFQNGSAVARCSSS